MVALAHGHVDVAFHVVVDYAGNGAFAFGNLCLFFKCVVATAYQRYLSLDVYRCVVYTQAVAGNRYVFESFCLSLGNAQLFEKVVGVARYCVGFQEEESVRIVAVGIRCGDVLALCTADGRHRQRRRIGGGRTYRTRIGIGNLVGVALFAAVGRTVTVAGGSEQTDAAFVDGVVHVVDFVSVLFTGKSARRTQRHIDGVNFQQNCVFQSGKNVVGVGAVVKVGEHFHQYQLSVDCHARDYVVLSADDAGNVCAVFAVVGENVAVFVGVVVHEGNFVAVIHVGNFKSRGGLCGIADCNSVFVRLSDYLLDFFLREEQIVPLGHILKHRVAAIETRVQNCNRRADTGVVDATGIEYTRGIHVHVVFYYRGVVGLCVLRTVVGVGKDNVLYRRHVLYFFHVAVPDGYGNGIDNCGIDVFDAFNQPFGLQIVDEFFLTFRNTLCLLQSFRRFGVFAYGRIGVCIHFVVGVDERFVFQRYHYHNTVVIFVTAVFQQVLRLYLRHYLVLRQFEIASKNVKLSRNRFFTRFFGNKRLQCIACDKTEQHYNH
ncbi:unknown [Corallococcus sp. CAG:1435]|nr:unknown [Corallococcus sp. CAG:1435]